MICSAHPPQNHPQSCPGRFLGEYAVQTLIFRKFMPKIENLKTSGNWILVHLAVGENPKAIDKNERENNSIKKNHAHDDLDKLGLGCPPELIQNHRKWLGQTGISPKPPTWNLFFFTSFWSKIISRYTGTIYRSRAFQIRVDIRSPMRTNHSQMLLKTEVLGKFQLWPREPP